MSENIEFEKAKIQAQQLFPEKNMAVGYILLFFLGFFGAHRFYYGKNGTAVLMIVLTLLVVTSFITAIWCLVDIYFVYKYNEEQNAEIKMNQIRYLEKIENKHKKR
jgi:TM2 domain-containing membrane protein YozV